MRWKVKQKPVSSPDGEAAPPPVSMATGLLVPPRDDEIGSLGSNPISSGIEPPPVDGAAESPGECSSPHVGRSHAASVRGIAFRLVLRPFDAPLRWLARRLGAAPSGWATSLLVHLLLLIALALIVPAVGGRSSGLRLTAPTTDGDTLDPQRLTAASPGVDQVDVAIDLPSFNQHANAANPLDVEPPKIDLAQPSDTARQTSDAAAPSSRDESEPNDSNRDRRGRQFVAGAGLGGRDAGHRARLVKEDGGTKTSEVAMEAGLIWIANHQRPNGAWLFDHREGPCQGQCRNPGTVASTTASTGLAILSFLGAGYTHREGPFQRELDKGLYYLTGRMLNTPHGGDMQEGTMYAQGIATLALCEAYAMTGDDTLRPFAQKAVDFIVYAQNPKTGGWRYFPGQPGDTTVLGWQLMALRSARMAELDVPEEVIYKATRYLDSVQDGDGQYRGAFYGYQSPDRTNFTTNSVGLLCRMYTGWERSNPALMHGVDAIAKQGPSRNDMYYNYQATQVMHHWGGKQWRKWNATLRDYLVRSQARHGHEFGSWYFDDKHSAQGGRLYNTAMAVMTLQVYYRYLPLYKDKAIAPGETTVSTHPPQAAGD